MNERKKSSDGSLGGLLKTLFGQNHEPPKPVASSERHPYRTMLDGESLILDVDLPGIAPQDVVLTVTYKQVIVKGVRDNVSFTQRYTLSADFDLSTASATMANGQLRVRVERLKPSAFAPRRVPIDYVTR